MHLITLDKWLSLFDLHQASFSEFKKTFTVKTNNVIISLNEVIKKKNLDSNTVKILYEVFVINKESYLTNFYNFSLKIPTNLILSESKDLKLSLNNSHNKKYKNLIRNLYYKELLLDTKTEIPNLRPFLEVLFDLFNKRIIDYKLVTPSAISLFKKKLFGPVLSGYYFRSSILNPAVIYSLSKKYLKNGSKIFTPTLGWSSYCFGFLSNPAVTEYVGIDVIPNVCKTTEKMAKKMFPEKKVDIYCAPSETFLTNKPFLRKYVNHFDIVFFSPPYYKLELYPGKMQSTNLYKSYEDWLQKYWESTVKLCKLVLKRGGIMVYIISGYDTKKTLCNDMNEVTKKYFKYLKKMGLGNTNVDFTKHKDTNELIFFFKKV